MCCQEPPGGEGWPRNSKNENLSASLSANCNISHLVKAAAPPTCYIDTLRHRLSIFHSIGETPNIGRNSRNFFTTNKWLKYCWLAIIVRNSEFMFGHEIWLRSPQHSPVKCHWPLCYQQYLCLWVKVAQFCANSDCLLVANVNVTDSAEILASDWSAQFTWPEHWPLIGWAQAHSGHETDLRCQAEEFYQDGDLRVETLVNRELGEILSSFC